MALKARGRNLPQRRRGHAGASSPLPQRPRQSSRWSSVLRRCVSGRRHPRVRKSRQISAPSQPDISVRRWTSLSHPTAQREVSGHVASQQDLDKLNRDVGAIRGIGPVKFDVGLMERPHCEVAAALAPLAGRQKLAPSLGFVANTKDVHIGDRLSLDIRAPGFDGYIYIDYFDRGGQVLHLFPNDRDFFNLRPERNHFIVFKPPLTSCWTFNGSVGQEMITLIAVSKPLFPAPRAEIENITDYLASLSSIIHNLSQDDGAASMLQFKLDAAAPWSTEATACPTG